MGNLKINIDRLSKNLNELAQIGMNENGGIDRALGDESDRVARKWLIDYWQNKMNKTVRIDAIANMWVRREGSENLPPIVVGSHHDAVPNGGKFDGALGVLLATELIQTLEDNNIKTKHPMEIVSFTGEEPNPFNVSTLGSKVLSGRLKKDDLMQLKSYIDGSSLQECIEKIGGDITKANEALIKENDIRAFMECHIEQGRRIYDKGLSSAAVNCIIGIYRENITIIGEANHAGTTLMQDRHDALLASGEFNLAFEKILKNASSDEVVGTIGYIKVFPNSANIIPGKIDLVLEIRTCDEKIKQDIIDRLSNETQKIENLRGVRIIRKVNLDQSHIFMDKDVVNAIKRSIGFIGEEEIELVSMAGHDAANMQRVTKSGMIFVQSIDGKSHCPEENTDIKEIEKTGNAMLKALLLLDEELN
ncbi:MAG TPA: Zn-dependent hydrolase [Lachnospiraceae bacterium]|nr:Zn-dependent hydrolase [Lachnospiraceae bacterium]